MEVKHLKKLKLPGKSGVYFFLKDKEILYVGKATMLSSRVRSYFGKNLIDSRGPLLVDMVTRANKIDWQETDSVLEALILEASLIKTYRPKYNTQAKDDKSFSYVVISKEKLPRVVIVRGRELGNFASAQNFFGPFTNGVQLKEALKLVRRIFPFLDDKSKNYEEFYRQINLVPDLKDTKMYLQNIKNIKLFFKGKKKAILKNLEKEMKEYAKRREFEKAGEIKRQIFALQHINDIALLKHENLREKDGHSFRIEAYDIAHMSGKNMVGVMTVIDLPAGRQEMGEVVKNEYKKFKIRTQSGANDTGALLEVLERRFNHKEWQYPSLVVVDGSVAQINVARALLKKLKINIPVVSVVKDGRHKAKALQGDEVLISKYKSAILLANSEAHRFAIAYHKNMRSKNFLPK